MRKYPVRHQVKAHSRRGFPVRSYIRGSGVPQVTYKRRLRQEGSSRKSMEDYEITFYYSKGRKETLPIAAQDSDDALNIALQRRKMTNLKPIKIVVKDGIGQILGKITGKVAGEVRSAIEAFRAEYAKGAPEREAAKQVREMSIAERERLREQFAKKQLANARKGDRTAQLWCERHNIGWEAV